MRGKVLVIFSLISGALGAQVEAQTNFHSFQWESSNHFTATLSHRGKSVTFKGEDFRDDKVKEATSADGRFKIELKSYASEGFLFLGFSALDEDNGSIFILKRENAVWRSQMSKPILSRRVDMMGDVTSVVQTFNKVYRYNVLVTVMAVTEYFNQNPRQRLQDLVRAVERQDHALRKMPRPPTTNGPNQGVVRQATPSGARPPPADPDQPVEQASEEQRPTRRKSATVESLPVEGGEEQPEGTRPSRASRSSDARSREREQHRQMREQRRRAQEAQPPGYNPYNQPRPQYGGGYYQRPQQQRSFWDTLFGN